MYNATCLITGKRDNLRMHAHRNEKGEMVGFVFLHESINIEKAEIELKINIKGSVSK